VKGEQWWGMEKQRVLIIDDDVDIANLFSMVLSLVGFDCEITGSAKEALSRLANRDPDLVLLDMRLGSELGGADILYQIRSNPRLKNTRVIVITGYPAMAEPITDLADLTLFKPVDVEQLKTLAARIGSDVQKPKTAYFHDPLTGLFNEDFFNTRLAHAVERARRRPDFIFAVCVFWIDVKDNEDNFVGPEIFDQILRDVAKGLMQSLRPTDTIARLSRNRFASLHEELKKPEDVVLIADRIRTILTSSFRLGERRYLIDFRIGKAVRSDYYEKAEEIIALAEKDMKNKPGSG
jgi:diguanylate cyclase (GGDEF)-like protein